MTANDNQPDDTELDEPQPDPVEHHDDTSQDPADADADAFPRDYVEELRKQSASYRTQLRQTQEQLHRTMVEKTGRLADPSDLPFDPAYVGDADALNAAIDELLAARPHLRSRRPTGDAGQGNRGRPPAGVNLVELLRGR
ncbi:hypothetical protein [Gordonia aichiensis]|uniref:hypothetical protein n=1 Tax=Gordonia aichiensis TaxID=36820 RepID=UPI003265D994